MNAQPQPFDYYLNTLKNNYAQFSGRARRSEFWYFALFNFLIGVGLAIVDVFVGTMALNGLYSLAVLVPSIAVAVRRLHDTGKSGLWVLAGFIPVIGFIILLVFLVQDSQPYQNQYGPNPKTAMSGSVSSDA
ncbi:DUF805 domain-containing protein [Pleomorphovibrio marinus]|uniref:DUF805 domain-containing protein n=1 Tax=Pleomorphovibrio marinus TaxID=2164132 RepID=UPI000E0AFA76|nr:DUF805 domain-containing protein [Pleomorphovibrio marinus]